MKVTDLRNPNLSQPVIVSRNTQQAQLVLVPQYPLLIHPKSAVMVTQLQGKQQLVAPTYLFATNIDKNNNWISLPFRFINQVDTIIIEGAFHWVGLYPNAVGSHANLLMNIFDTNNHSRSVNLLLDISGNNLMNDQCFDEIPASIYFKQFVKIQ